MNTDSSDKLNYGGMKIALRNPDFWKEGLYSSKRRGGVKTEAACWRGDEKRKHRCFLR